MRTVVLHGWCAGDIVGDAGREWSMLMVARNGRPRSLATLWRYDCEKMLSAHPRTSTFLKQLVFTPQVDRLVLIVSDADSSHTLLINTISIGGGRFQVLVVG
jgi:hypothetical protein